MFDTMAGDCCLEAAAVTAQLSPVEFWGIVIAAVAGVVGVLLAAGALVQTHLANRDAAQRDERITTTLGGMAEDIDRLTEVTEQVALRMPEPNVCFVLDDGPSDSAGFRLAVPAAVNTEVVVAAALERANATRPVIERADSLWAVTSITSPTEYDVEEYDKEVAKFIESLRAGLADHDDHERDVARLIPLRVRLANEGAAPLQRARIVVSMPDGLTPRDGIPKPDELPEVPYWRNPRLSIPSIQPIHIQPLQPESRWLVPSSFRRVKTLGAAEWVAGDVQHGGYENAVLVLAAERPGKYTLPWRVHANNLVRPAEGTLTLVVDPPGNDPPRKLSTLADVGIPEAPLDEDE